MSAVRPPFDVALPGITDEILESYGGGFTFIEQNEREWTQEAVDFAAEVVRPAVQQRIRELEAALREADCPRPINGAGVMLEDHTVGLCVKLGYCGCGNAALLAADRGDGHG